MFDILRSARARTIFIILSSLLAILAFAVGAYFDKARQGLNAVQALQDGAAQLLFGIAGSIVGAGVVVFVFRLFKRSEDRMSQVECLDVPQTRKEHERALATTDFWYHDGHLARWVRTTAVEELRRRAGQGGTKTIKALIIDPRDHEMVRGYAQYRARIGYREDHFVTADDTVQEVLATVLALQMCHEENSGLRVSLYFRTVLSNSRLDFSSSRVLRTLVDPRVPSTVYYNQTDDVRADFYHALLEEFDNRLRASEEFQFVQSSGLVRGKLRPAAVRSYLEAAGLSSGRPDAFYKLVIDRVESKFNGLRPHR